MKKLVSILCAFALVFGLAGCGQEKKPEKKVTITIAAAASLEKTFEETLIPRFEKKYNQRERYKNRCKRYFKHH